LEKIKNTMQHLTCLHYSFCKPLLLVLALFLSSTSFLSAAPPIDLLDKREVVIDQKDKKAAKAAKKQWKKERRKKIRNEKADRKTSRGKKLATTFIIIGMVLGILAFVVMTAVAVGFGGDFSIAIFPLVGALFILILGLWGISKVNQKESPFMRTAELILIVISTIALVLGSIFFMVIFDTPLSYVLFGLLAAAVLFFGVWLFIRSLRR
jgi:hypothetical protein